MNPWYQSYNELKSALYPLLESNHRNVELCIRQWKQVETQFLQTPSRTKQVEIQFFRFVKPRFSALVEFYILSHESLFFCPVESLEALRYWKRELDRIDQFHFRNADFLAYYHSGDCDRDPEYFSLSVGTASLAPEELIYFDECCRSEKDAILRRYYAFQLYRKYAQYQLSKYQQLVGSLVMARC